MVRAPNKLVYSPLAIISEMLVSPHSLLLTVVLYRLLVASLTKFSVPWRTQALEKSVESFKVLFLVAFIPLRISDVLGKPLPSVHSGLPT